MARDFIQVCNDVFSCIPEEIRQEHPDFEKRLGYIQKRAGFRPPEMMGASWADLNGLCQFVAPMNRPAAEWKDWEVRMYSTLSMIPMVDIWNDIRSKG